MSMAGRNARIRTYPSSWCDCPQDRHRAICRQSSHLPQAPVCFAKLEVSLRQGCGNFEKHQSDSYLDCLLDLDGRVDVDILLNLHRHWHLHVFSIIEIYLQEQGRGNFHKAIIIT